MASLVAKLVGGSGIDARLAQQNDDDTDDDAYHHERRISVIKAQFLDSSCP
jgi:hypothetical protein